MDFLCLLCRRGLARADGPDGLVGDYGSGELGRREVVDNLFDLCLYYVEVAVRFAFLEVLAHAVDRLQTVGECLRHLFVERRRGFAVVLAAFRVTQDDVTAAQGCEHRGRYFARIGAFVFGRAVLGADFDVRTPKCLDDSAEVGEGRTYDEIHAGTNLVSVGPDVFGQFDAFGGKRIHLPVAGNDFLSHIFVFKID